MNEGWRSIWERRSVAESEPTLSDLILADGFDTAFGSLTVEAWADFVLRTCDLMQLDAGDSLFEVGCGSGAFLYLPYQSGVTVGGVDYSEPLVAIARRALPNGGFSVGEANSMETAPPADVVMSCFVFSYFESLDYPREVIRRMCMRATRSIGILDIPDAATAQEAMEHREAALGGPEAYRQRYASLNHKPIVEIRLRQPSKMPA